MKQMSLILLSDLAPHLRYSGAVTVDFLMEIQT
jgi:hypothetical protein